MSDRPPRPPAGPATAIAVAIALAGCGTPVPPTGGATASAPPSTLRTTSAPSTAAGLDGLLLAAGGTLSITADDGRLVPLDDGPANAVAVSTGPAMTVVVDDAGRAWIAAGPVASATWALLVPDAADNRATPLIAVSPTGDRLAVVEGALQSDAFELAIVAMPSGTTRRVRIRSGANGPPAWLDGSTVVVDAIAPNGASSLAAIAVDSGAVTDRAGPGIEIAMAPDAGRIVAIGDDGRVVVLAAAAWRRGDVAQALDLDGDSGWSAEHVAIDAAGARIAVTRRSDDGRVVLELWRLDGGGWRRALSLPIRRDAPVSIAWAR